MFGTLTKGLKLIGKTKRIFDALDDDVDQNGKREQDELKESYEHILFLFKALSAQVQSSIKHVVSELVPTSKELFTEGKRFVSIASRLIEHVAKAGG